MRLTSHVPLPPPLLLAGDFTSTIMVHNGTTSRPLSLADGHLLLADSAARACGYSASVFGEQRKLVLSYWAGPDSGPRSFSLCNSADFMQNMWLLTCPRPLETRDGADAAAEGCWCALPTAHHPCDTGAYGFQLTTDTRPGHWWVYLWRSCLDEKGAAGFWNGGALCLLVSLLPVLPEMYRTASVLTSLYCAALYCLPAGTTWSSRPTRLRQALTPAAPSPSPPPSSQHRRQPRLPLPQPLSQRQPTTRRTKRQQDRTSRLQEPLATTATAAATGALQGLSVMRVSLLMPWQAACGCTALGCTKLLLTDAW